MNCHATRAVLDLHAEKRLSSRRTKSVLQHLASCADCRAKATEPYGEGAPLPHAVSKEPPAREFKERLAAAMKAERAAPAARPVDRPELNLCPRDFSGVALAAASLALIAVIIGWSGVPSQRDISGDDLELAAGRTP